MPKWTKCNKPNTKPKPNNEMIRARAYLLGQISPWRSDEENWLQAEQELSNPKWNSGIVSIWRWLGFSERSDKKGLEACVSMSIPLLLFIGGIAFNYWNSQQTERIALEARDDQTLREYMRDMRTILLDSKLSQEVRRYGSDSHSVARAYTYSALTQFNGESRLAGQRRTMVFTLLREAKASILAGSVLRCFDLRGARMTNSNLSWADLSGAKLSGSNLNGSHLVRTSFVEADLSGAGLTEANLQGADLRSADLQGAILGRVLDLQGADMRGADLRGADLRGAYLLGVDFRGADLRGADMRGIDLRTIDLRQAKLESAYINVNDRPIKLPSQSVCQ